MWTLPTWSVAVEVTSVNILTRIDGVPYHHGNLRAALIDAGVELARTHGPEGVVLREVARRTSVSHNAAYRHFADREELLGEIAARGADQLELAMRRRLATVGAPDAPTRARLRLREIGRAYVEFALAEPGLFAVAFSAEAHRAEAHGSGAGEGAAGGAAGGAAADAGVGAGDAAAEPAPGSAQLAAPYLLLGQALDEMVRAGVMPPAARPGADVACWSAVHGYALLHLAGPLRDVPATERDAALDALLDLVERGLTADSATAERE